ARSAGYCWGAEFSPRRSSIFPRQLKGAFMRITRSSALLAFALLFAFASTACAAGPQSSILGPGGSPFGGYDPNVMTMSTCGGPIGSGWGAYGGAGWKVGQQFIPTSTDVALGIRIGCSMKGFTSF